MNIYIITGVILVVLVLILIILKNFNKKSNNNENEQMQINFKKHLLKVNLPLVVKKLNKKELRLLAQDELKTYKALDYKNKLLKDMVDLEWHTWQVSVIIKMYKEEMDIYLPDYQNIFPKELVDLSVYSLEQKLHPIFEKYNKEVSQSGTKKYLLDQVIWTSKDISILLLFLVKYKKDENNI